MIEFFRTSSKMKCSFWDDKKLCILEISPVLATASKGQPKKGEQKYNYNNKSVISFNGKSCLEFAYYLNLLSLGHEVEYSKFADTNKRDSENGEQKKLTVNKGSKGGVAFSLVSGDKKNFITISEPETFALYKYLETLGAQILISNENGSHHGEQ